MLKALCPKLVLVCLLGGLLTGCLPPPPESVDGHQPPGEPAEQELVPAKPGVGKQGRIVAKSGGYLSTTASAFFKTKQRIVFDIQIVQAMRLYEAEHGHPPKTGDEFMDRIIRTNNIRLPELPEGHEYFYDPQAGQLMVRRPAGEQE